LALAPHPELLRAYNSLAHSITELAEQPDDILREAALLKLAAVEEGVRRWPLEGDVPRDRSLADRL